jgi:hypothetical protein
MDILHYYELKQKYQESIDRRKNTIKKKKDLSIKERRTQIKKLIGKCVNCNKPGGTIFEEKNGTLKAVCGNKTKPCNLNINIKRKLYDNMRDLEQKNNKRSESLKMLIIMTKLDYLFGLVHSKDEIVDKFNTFKNELAQINEIQLVSDKKYGDILSGIHREPLLNDASLELVNEIDELKKIYQEYLADPLPAYITSMVEKYLTTIKPLTEKIRNMNYGYYAIETNIDKEDSAVMEGDETMKENSDKTSDADVAREKKAIYTLVALPYRLEQLEQERKHA